MTYTHFWDMNSGGTQKTDFGHIFIENGKKNPSIFFEDFFGENPEDVACDCCGSNFAVSEIKSLKHVYKFCNQDDGRFVRGSDVIIITQKDISNL